MGRTVADELVVERVDFGFTTLEEPGAERPACSESWVRGDLDFDADLRLGTVVVEPDDFSPRPSASANSALDFLPLAVVDLVKMVTVSAFGSPALVTLDLAIELPLLCITSESILRRFVEPRILPALDPALASPCTPLRLRS